MNLLRIQDALKNASDQQLMQMMQAPDSTAPSYLVLSEIRRRKDMRAKQAPEGDSRRTVAEELTAPEDQGIRAMAAQMPEEPPQDVADQAGIEAMREGGVVRMQAGGDIMGDIPFPPTNYESMTVPPAFAGRPTPGEPLPMVRSFRPQTPDIRLSVAERELQSLFRANPRMRGDSSLIDQTAQQFGVSPSALRARVMGETPVPVEAPGGVTSLAPDMPMRPQVAALADDEQRGVLSSIPTGDADRGSFVQPDPTETQRQATTGQTQGQPGQGQQGQRQGQQGQQQGQPGQPRPAGGGAAAAPASAEAGLPTLADIYRQNQGLFADGIGALRERAQQERVDPAARRNEALNMALIEAGLRIAGSRNPSLAGAIGEGAVPAVQSYGQQLGQIRAEQREARRDELELAKQDLNRQFAIGQISATEYRTRMDNVNANLRAASAERAAGARAAAAEDRADQRLQAQSRLQAEELRRRGYYTPEEFAALPPAQQATVRELRSMGRPLDTAGINTVLNATVTEIGRIRTEMDGDPAPRPNSSGYAAWQQRNAERERRLREAEGRRRQFEDALMLGRQPGGQAGAGGQGSGISRFGG